ncbi:hypothetical protein Pssp01_59880 [Pseudomonas sp. NBRC 100443]|nr:hypothetical protein Pssp01_59880 [Pseudomonas sp. NBRC 100443]
MRGMAQGLAVEFRQGLVEVAQALLGIRDEGVQQQRKLFRHHLPQSLQYGIVEMHIGHSLTPWLPVARAGAREVPDYA